MRVSTAADATVPSCRDCNRPRFVLFDWIQFGRMTSFCYTPVDFRSNEPLKPYTTFKIGGPASFFANIRTPDEIREALAFRSAHNLGLFILGGGSNILVSDRGFDGLVVHTAGRGLRVAEENDRQAVLRIGAGET